MHAPLRLKQNILKSTPREKLAVLHTSRKTTNWLS
uniref:Uncharacterized protein n=1 Tax=Manihot esculenta TaxID=3983 RepID=A0A2C9VA75_MANES